jgi:Lipid A 3-O-deacylase (PagL)
MTFRILISIVFVFAMAPFLAGQSLADSAGNCFEPELHFHVGKLVKIHGEYPESDVASLTELNFSFRTRGKRCWHQKRGFPSTGVSLVYAGFGNKEILGHAVGLLPHVRVPLGKSRFWVKMGMGAAWFSSPFDAIENPENLVIGTRVANLSQFWIGSLWPLGHQLRLTTGISLTHCSNFHLAVPNIGANLVALGVGLSWTSDVNRLNQTHQIAVCPQQLRGWRPGAHLLLGVHEFQGTIRPYGGPIYPVYGFSVFARRELPGLDAVSVGINAHYYTAFHDYTISQQLDNAEGDVYARNIVVYAQYEWMWGHFGVVMQGGLNVYAPFYQGFSKTWDLPKKGWVNLWTANKVGYRYYFQLRPEHRDRRVFAGLSLKANGGTADFLESSLGFVW